MTATVGQRPPIQSRRSFSKRRRLFDVGLLLFIIAAVAWWYWPREDSRFTGRWHDPLLGGIWTFQSNGIASWQGFKGAEISHGWTHWHTDGRILWIGVPEAIDSHPLLWKIQSLLARIGDHPQLMSGPTYELNSVTPDALWILAPSKADPSLIIRFHFDRYRY